MRRHPDDNGYARPVANLLTVVDLNAMQVVKVEDGGVVTPRERYAAGDHPHQHPGGAGLPTYVQDDASLENTDVVLWYTFGSHHIVRPEDWPVMPVMAIGFKLKPVGFFDRNPALDVPAPTPHCCVNGVGNSVAGVISRRGSRGSTALSGGA